MVFVSKRATILANTENKVYVRPFVPDFLDMEKFIIVYAEFQ